MEVQLKVVDIEKVLCFELTEDGQKKQTVDTKESLHLGWLSEKTASSFTPGADSAGRYIWTGIQFNMYLTRLPFSEYLMQINFSTVKMPNNCISMFTF